jgi:hypothetical protein
MTIVETILKSEARPLIDQMLLEQAKPALIARAVAEKMGIIFQPDDIARYQSEQFDAGESPLQQIAKVARDIANGEPPPTDEFAKLSLNFSFKKTNEDLELLYDRIRKLRKRADEEPEDPTYDRRIKEYIAQAEAIRTRVYKHQYEQIRHAILLTVGKKLCTAAISILMPYIHKEYRSEAMRRFQSAVEPLLDMRSLPDMPVDVAGDDARSP